MTLLFPAILAAALLWLPLPCPAQVTAPAAKTAPVPDGDGQPQLFMLPMLAQAERGRWLAVGAVNGAGRTSRAGCTGTLVAPALVLTAAHCAPSTDGPDANGPRRTFVAGLDIGGHVTHRVSVSIEQHPAYQVAQGNARYAYDMALITLEEAIPADVVAPLGVAPESGPWREGPLAIVGYAKRRPYALSGRFDCEGLGGADPRLILTDCPVVSGNSGAPLLALVDGEWQVAGVVVATLGKVGPARSMAIALPAWARERIAAARAVNP